MPLDMMMEECKMLVRCVVRDGFEISRMNSMSSVELGHEYDLGVLLVISTGCYEISHVLDWAPGIREGLRDIARDGIDGKMILYGLAFHFRRVLTEMLQLSRHQGRGILKTIRRGSKGIRDRRACHDAWLKDEMTATLPRKKIPA